MTMRWSVLRVVVLTLAAVTALAACEGEDATETTEEPAATSVEVTADEYTFDPADVTAAADEDVEVTLDNVGQLPHEWVVLSAGAVIESEAEFSEDLVAFETEADPGQTGTGSMSLPADTYQVICAVPGHFDAGMEATLTLE